MASLAWVMLAVGLTQPAAPSPPNPTPPPTPKTPSTSLPPSLDEVIVTAPRQVTPAGPTYSVVTGPRAREFEAETTRAEEMHVYRDTGNYPGMRCAILHRC